MESSLLILKSFLEEFTSEFPSGLVVKGRKVFFAPSYLVDFVSSVKRDYFSIGLFFGEAGREFVPSPSLLDWLGERTSKKVVVNSKAEWLFLCGRDVFRSSVVEGFDFDGRVLVVNSRGEVLGLGLMVKRKVWVKNLFDRGSYLR